MIRLTGWPRQAKRMPPPAADTITMTRSEMNLQNINPDQEHGLQNCKFNEGFEVSVHCLPL